MVSNRYGLLWAKKSEVYPGYFTPWNCPTPCIVKKRLSGLNDSTVGIILISMRTGAIEDSDLPIQSSRIFSLCKMWHRISFFV